MLFDRNAVVLWHWAESQCIVDSLLSPPSFFCTSLTSLPCFLQHQNNKQETVLPVLFHHTSPCTCRQYLQALGAMLPVHVLQRSVISHKYNSSLIKLWYAKVSGKLISYWHFAKFNVKLPSLNMRKISKPLRGIIEDLQNIPLFWPL